ncbi:MAG: cytochrome c oxidase subunit II [Candidatus Eremiobacteraeota bacterium]|nr:cytochrome c oxidase subunit II [Candidatus Eremiobacteraeota bacterium]MBV8642664.1 cytochrome c oxidase subunit II [Candidatus Eremiobacteraeota bacterium]
MHVHRQERLWMALGIAMLVVFLAVITTAAVVDGFVPPSHVQSIDPTRVSETPPFDHPGLRKVADGAYEAYYVARVFSFTPASIDVPAGARVTFYVTSADVEHGFSIPETGVNTMVTPGWVSTVSHTFKEPGTFLLVCNEYCGAGHHLMAAKVVVK